jgi:Helicase conserved C-terminal domain
MDSGVDTRERARLVAQFAPRANNKPEIAGSDSEIDILISTDVLSEGQNLQDCGVLINYDLHWKPTRMVQRAGRIDHIGTSFDTLWVLNMFPDEGLEKLLGLVESLSQKIASIDRSGFLDASILGEVVHPQNFNTLRRIEEEDSKVVEEQEQFVELLSSEFLLQNLKNLLDTGMRNMLEELPDGIHSGLVRQGAKGVFFYFTSPGNVGAPLAGARLSPSLVGALNAGSWNNASARPSRQHYWRYIDLSQDQRGGRIEDNRYLIMNLIQCQPDTPRVVPFETEIDIFALQEKVIASILQSSEEQVAVEEAPKLLDPIQQTIATTLQGYINSPAVSRKEIIAATQRLNEPQPGVYIKTLREAYGTFTASGQLSELLAAVKSISAGTEAPNESTTSSPESKSPVKREDLKLICFDYLWH